MGVRKVAVTGGVACGKSTVCQFFRNLGALVVSADQIVHQLLSNDQEVKSKVIELLGLDVLENGHLQREKIAKKVFNDKKTLKELEKILFPKVFEEIDLAYHNTTAPLFVAEVPLLFEAHAEDNFETVITVAADEQIIHQRNPLFAKRAPYQMPLEEKINQATFVIYNNGTLQELNDEVKKCYQSILQGD